MTKAEMIAAIAQAQAEARLYGDAGRRASPGL